MARVLIFDSNATVDANGDPVGPVATRFGNSILRPGGGPVIVPPGWTGPWNGPVYTKAIPLIGCADGEINKIAFEFLGEKSTGEAGTAVDLRWWMEFYNDSTKRYPLPGDTLILYPELADDVGTYNDRVSPDVAVGTPWVRESTEVLTITAGVTNARIVEHYPIERQLVFPPDASLTDSRYFPFVVHALFVRIGLVSPTPATPPGWRLRIWAIVGGIDSQDALEKAAYPWTGK